MSTQKPQLAYSANTNKSLQTKSVSTPEQFKNALTSLTSRFWQYTEETSKSDTSSYDGIL